MKRTKLLGAQVREFMRPFARKHAEMFSPPDEKVSWEEECLKAWTKKLMGLTPTEAKRKMPRGKKGSTHWWEVIHECKTILDGMFPADRRTRLRILRDRFAGFSTEALAKALANFETNEAYLTDTKDVMHSFYADGFKGLNNMSRQALIEWLDHEDDTLAEFKEYVDAMVDILKEA